LPRLRHPRLRPQGRAAASTHRRGKLSGVRESGPAVAADSPKTNCRGRFAVGRSQDCHDVTEITTVTPHRGCRETIASLRACRDSCSRPTTAADRPMEVRAMTLDKEIVSSLLTSWRRSQRVHRSRGKRDRALRLARTFGSDRPKDLPLRLSACSLDVALESAPLSADPWRGQVDHKEPSAFRAAVRYRNSMRSGPGLT